MAPAGRALRRLALPWPEMLWEGQGSWFAAWVLRAGDRSAQLLPGENPIGEEPSSLHPSRCWWPHRTGEGIRVISGEEAWSATPWGALHHPMGHGAIRSGRDSPFSYALSLIHVIVRQSIIRC